MLKELKLPEGNEITADWVHPCHNCKPKPPTITPPPPTFTPPPEQPKPEKLVCKRDSTVGTRLSQSICLTRSQWRARDRAMSENKDNLVNKVNGGAATPMPNGSGN